VPFPRAEGDQTACQSRRPAVGLRVAEALGVAHQERVLCPGAGLLPQNFATVSDSLGCSTGWQADSVRSEEFFSHPVEHAK